MRPSTLRRPSASSPPSTYPRFRRSASLHPSRPPRPRRHRLLLAGLGFAASAGLIDTVAVAASAGGPPAVSAPASAPAVDRWAGDASHSRQARSSSVLRPASRSQRRAALRRRVLVSLGPAVTGVASWYGPGFAGRRTANGEVYDPQALTAASRTLPLGSLLRVCHQAACVVVRINDRGPYVGARILDLSHAAAQAVGLVDAGTGWVSATPVGWR